jgi:hypothetical protein
VHKGKVLLSLFNPSFVPLVEDWVTRCENGKGVVCFVFCFVCLLSKHTKCQIYSALSVSFFLRTESNNEQAITGYCVMSMLKCREFRFVSSLLLLLFCLKAVFSDLCSEGNENKGKQSFTVRNSSPHFNFEDCVSSN